MRAVIQRSREASVTVAEKCVGAIEHGLVVFLGVQARDTEKDIKWMAEKIRHLRIFEDDEGKMNHSLQDRGGKMLIISQFTLYGDCRKGRRPSYSQAAGPEFAKKIYDLFIEEVKKSGIGVATGIFQADMDVQLINDGPVTMLLDSEKNF